MTPPSGAPAAAAAASAPYEVHEWGLLRAAAGDVLEAGAVAPPGEIIYPMAVDKPVLYFHASAPVRLEHVRVEAVGGTVREHWPLTGSARFPTAIDWTDVALLATERAGGARCGGVFPDASMRPCADLAGGEACESPGLPALVSPAATCLGNGASRLPFLFYRSRTSTFTPPLRVRRLPSGDLELTNTGDAPIPGWVVRMRRGSGQVRTLAVRGPGARATVTLGSDFANPVVPSESDGEQRPASDQPALPGSEEPGRQGVRLTLRDLGLDAGETDAFLRAWDAALFGERYVALVDVLRADDESTMSDSLLGSHRRKRLVSPDADDETTMSDSLLYFLPEATCDGVSRLSFVPAPTRVRRALALWQPTR